MLSEYMQEISCKDRFRYTVKQYGADKRVEEARAFKTAGNVEYRQKKFADARITYSKVVVLSMQ